MTRGLVNMRCWAALQLGVLLACLLPLLARPPWRPTASSEW